MPIPAATTPAEPAYATPRQPDYVSAAPGFPAPWGTAYAQPGGGGADTGPAMPPPRFAPGPRDAMRPYVPPPPSSWGQRPGPAYGTAACTELKSARGAALDVRFLALAGLLRQGPEIIIRHGSAAGFGHPPPKSPQSHGTVRLVHRRRGDALRQFPDRCPLVPARVREFAVRVAEFPASPLVKPA